MKILKTICYAGILFSIGCSSTSSSRQRSAPPQNLRVPVPGPAPVPIIVPGPRIVSADSRPIGTVTVINQFHHFALLDVPSSPPPGTLVACVSGSQQTALLRVALPSRPPFLIADIVEGKPSIGEKIFLAQQ
jgi:hypothetical protein